MEVYCFLKREGKISPVWGIYLFVFYVSQGRAVRFSARKHMASDAETYVSGQGNVGNGEGFPHDL